MVGVLHMAPCAMLGRVGRGLVCASVLAVAGCSFVGSSSLHLPDPAACTSDFGAYYLPKHYVTIALQRVQLPGGGWLDSKGRGAYKLVRFGNGAAGQGANGAAGQAANGSPLEVVARPDPNYGFCLDYLATLTSKDRLVVDRDSSGLLTKVTTWGNQYPNATGDTDPIAGSADVSASSNESERIAQKMTQAAFTGIARQPDCTDESQQDNLALQKYCACRAQSPPNRLGQCARYLTIDRPLSRPDVTHRGDFSAPGDSTSIKTTIENFDTVVQPNSVALSLDFDPTDPYEAAVFNKGLIEHDHCAFLGDGKIDLRDAKRYCQDPWAYAQSRGFRPRAKPSAAGSHREPSAFRPYKGGVLYRARVTFPFYIFKRVGGNWQLVHQEKVELANTGPIVSVGVDRALFASRNTEVVFDKGTLNKITIKKGSELQAFAGIPLALVTSIVKLPSQVLLMKIDQTTDTTQLIQVNQAIIDAQMAYNKTLADLQTVQAEADAKGVPGTLDPDRRTKLLQACESVLGPQQGKSSLETCRTIVDQSYNQ